MFLELQQFKHMFKCCLPLYILSCYTWNKTPYQIIDMQYEYTKKILHSSQIKKIHQRQEPIDTPRAGISPCVSCLLVSSKWCEIENVKKCCCFTYSSQNCLFRQPKSDRVITWFISPNNCQRQKKPNGVHGLIRGLEVYHILPLMSKIQVKNAPQSRTLWNPQL